MFSERTSVGLDVHARSIVGCGLDTVSGAVVRRRLTPTVEGVSAWLAELPAYRQCANGSDGCRGRLAGEIVVSLRLKARVLSDHFKQAFR